jgi:hypothetical protein
MVEPILIVDHGLLATPQPSSGSKQDAQSSGSPALDWSTAPQQFHSYKISHWRHRGKTGGPPTPFFSLRSNETNHFSATLAPLRLFISSSLIADLHATAAFFSEVQGALKDLSLDTAFTPTAPSFPQNAGIQLAALHELDLTLDYLDSAAQTLPAPRQESSLQVSSTAITFKIRSLNIKRFRFQYRSSELSSSHLR